MEEELREIRRELNSNWQQQFAALEEIAQLTDMNFATYTATVLDPKKHLYSFNTYIGMLARIKGFLSAGMAPFDALEAVQAGCEIGG